MARDVFVKQSVSYVWIHFCFDEQQFVLKPKMRPLEQCNLTNNIYKFILKKRNNGMVTFLF